MEKTYYMIAREKKYIQHLDKALLMIKEGMFGICVSCKKLIDKERLQEVPHTTKCFDWKSYQIEKTKYWGSYKTF